MKTQKRKVKKIIFRFRVKGQGIVNYDGKEQRHILKALGFGNESFSYKNNESYSKKHFWENADGTSGYGAKISSNCMKKNMFENDRVSEQGGIQHMKHLDMALKSSPLLIIRGYLQTVAGGIALSRTSCLNMTDALQDNNAIINMEFFTKSGKKKDNEGEKEEDPTVKDDEKKGSNSIHRKDTVGKITYKAEGEIGIKRMEFVSTDDVFGRLALDSDDFELFSHFARLQIPNYNSELGYYRMASSFDLTPEYGFVFNNDNKNFFVKFILERLMSLQIVRTKANAYAHDLEIKFVYDPIEDTFDSEDGWIKMATRNDLDSFHADFEEFYIREDEEESKKLRVELERLQKENVEKTKVRLKNVAAEKKAQKESSEKKAPKKTKSKTVTKSVRRVKS
jgi:hypothetical protein